MTNRNVSYKHHANLIVFTITIMLGGCSSLAKPAALQLSSLSLLKGSARSEADGPRTKPLSNSEQRKLYMTSAESMAKSQHWSECVQLYKKAESTGKWHRYLDAELAPALAADAQFEEAVLRYRRMLQKHPEDVDLQINLAWTLMESEDFSSSETILRDLIAKNPDHPKGTVNLATLLATTGRNDEAYEFFCKVLTPSDSYHNLGLIYLELGQIDQAMIAFEKATQYPSSNNSSSEFLFALQTNSQPIARR